MAWPRHILVAVDGSPSSLRAVDEAVELAEAYEIPITLLQVIEPAPVTLPREVTDQVRELANAELEKRAAALAPYLSQVGTVVAEGIARDQIIRLAEDRQADVIMMGTQGRHGIGRVLLGSVAERVVRLSPLPVLTVPGHAFRSRKQAAEQLADSLGDVDLDLHASAVVALSRDALGIAVVLARRLSGTVDLWLPEEAKTGPIGERAIVLVTDGLDAEGPAIAAANALRELGPRAIVLATPVASRPAMDAAEEFVDRIVCVHRATLGGRETWYRVRPSRGETRWPRTAPVADTASSERDRTPRPSRAVGAPHPHGR
jgi:nucleotide-binding universal stress UspA family protein